MNKWWWYLLSLLVILGCLAMRSTPAKLNPSSSPAREGEQLIIITQAEDGHFVNNCLTPLKAWAAAEGIKIRQLDPAAGIPEGITATPAILFQNKQGRAIYTSRYAELGTIKNFVRTNRVRPQPPTAFCADDVLQWKSGRAKLNAPIKLTPLRGEVGDNSVAVDFAANALTALTEGMTNFQLQEEACLTKTDRAFYCDVHPYLSAEGELFLSLEIFSMFNCIRPVFSTGDQPLRASFVDYQRVFQKAGQLFQAQIIANITASEIGDAWTPLSSTTPSTNWEKLGLDIDNVQAVTAVLPKNFALAKSWRSSGAAIPGVASLFFRFLEPLDRYAGEVPEFTGTLDLAPNRSLQKGRFTANLSSLTMGMDELDDKVKRKYIYTKRFPEASFTFDLPDPDQPLLAGQTNRVPVEGLFTFMDKELPLRVQAELTPQLGEQGEQQLLVHVQFELNVTDDFGVQGPDGPDPARKTMVFDLNFFMSPR
jgi:polyisoprenoid-binding protein YceI